MIVPTHAVVLARQVILTVINAQEEQRDVVRYALQDRHLAPRHEEAAQDRPLESTMIASPKDQRSRST